MTITEGAQLGAQIGVQPQRKWAHPNVGLQILLWDIAAIEFEISARIDASRHFLNLQLQPQWMTARYNGRLAYEGLMSANRVSLNAADDDIHVRVRGPSQRMQFVMTDDSLRRLFVESGRDHGRSSIEVTRGGFRDDRLVREVGARVLSRAFDDDSGSRLFMQSVEQVLVSHVLAEWTAGGRVPLKQRSRLPGVVVARIEDFMHAHLAADIGLAELASHCGSSSFHFAHLFKASTGKSPYRYLLEMRMERAEALLAGTSMEIAWIAAVVGYEDASVFTRQFRRELGVSPGHYRMQRKR